MNFQKYYILLLFLITNFSIIQAQSISGNVLSTDSEPIPYATIQIGDKYGTISNEEGNFNISITGFTETEIVKISYLGYETIEVPINQFSSKAYILKERFDVLSEVYLTNKKLSVEAILLKVRENVATNYNSNTESQLFYRSTSVNTPKKMDFEVLKASELKKKTIKDINSQFETLRDFAQNKTSSYYTDILLNYSKLEDSSKINIVKATKLINDIKDKSTDRLQNDFIEIIGKQLDSGATYKVKSGLFKLDDSLKVGNTFNKKKDLPKTKTLVSKIRSLIEKHSIDEDSNFSFIFNESKNEYVLDGVTYFNNTPVYKISFTPKRKSEKFEGVFYVDMKDFAVIKVDYNLGDDRFGRRLNLKMLAGIKLIENKITGSVLYQKDEDGFYKPQFINLERQQYVYLSRPFKFIKNIVDEDDEKTTFKFKFKVESTSLAKEELYFIDNKLTTETSFSSFKADKNYKIDKIETYNPEIWKDYKVIAPIEAIKNYHLED